MLPENHWALKEWGVVCAAIAAGRQTLLLRKGGVAEGAAGFTVEHPEFWLLPTRFHQSLAQLRPEAAELLADAARLEPPPGILRLDLYAVVTAVEHVVDESRLEALVPKQVLSAQTARERFHYRRPGLYALRFDVFRRESPHEMEDRPEYGGCHSWVPLAQRLPTDLLRPVPRRTASRPEGTGPA
jgi:hypothetical protein